MVDGSSAHARIADRLDARIEALRGRLLELLAAMVAIDSSSPGPGEGAQGAPGSGEAAVNDLLERWYHEAGLAVARVSGAPGRPNLVGTRAGSGGGRSLALNAHVDTVAPVEAGSWTADPWTLRLDGDAAHGLGVAESKGAGALLWLVARALHDEGIGLAGDLVLHSVVGGTTLDPDAGTAAALRAGPLPDAAVVLAPVGDAALATCAAGEALVRVTVLGKVTHCGNRPQAIRPGGAGDAVGVNALERALPLVEAVRDLDDRWAVGRSHPAFAPGAFTLGVDSLHADAGFPFPAYFPDRAVFQVTARYPPGLGDDLVVTELDRQLRLVAGADPWLVEHPPEIDLVAGRGPMETAWDHPFVRAVAGAMGDVLGGPVDPPGPGRPRALEASCEGAHYHMAGVPVVALGPGRLADTRRPDEHLPVDHLVRTARVLVRVALRWCGVAAR